MFIDHISINFTILHLNTFSSSYIHIVHVVTCTERPFSKKIDELYIGLFCVLLD